MNRSLAFVCACIAGAGLLILSRSIYCTIVYGRGNMEAGNFHRCRYWAEQDLNGKLTRDWDLLGESTESSEAPLYWLDMWFFSIGLVKIGGGLFLAERAKHRRPPLLRPKTFETETFKK